MEQQQMVSGKADEEGRLERLPEGLLQHILSYLGPNDAAEVGMLSKTLYHAWSLQPILKCRLVRKVPKDGEDDVDSDNEEELIDLIEKDREGFIKYVNKSLERYCSQNRCPQQLHLTMICRFEPCPSSLVERLLGDIEESGVPAIHIDFCVPDSYVDRYVGFPDLSRVLECKRLVELTAKSCTFNQEIDKRTVRCSLLRKLNLFDFDMDEDTLQSIISTCPMLEKLEIYHIQSLERIKVANLHCLKKFSVSCYQREEHDIEVEVEAPSLEDASFEFRGQFKLSPSNNLKKLHLQRVNIPDKFLTDLKDNFPKLEDLSISCCRVFEILKIESKSLRCLSIHIGSFNHQNVEIDAPNLVSFKYSGSVIPSLNSMATITSLSTRECQIMLRCLHCRLNPEWLIHLMDMLKKLIKFKVTMTIAGHL